MRASVKTKHYYPAVAHSGDTEGEHARQHYNYHTNCRLGDNRACGIVSFHFSSPVLLRFPVVPSETLVASEISWMYIFSPVCVGETDRLRYVRY